MSAPNISLMNAIYSAVSGVTLPKSGGGTATFPWVEGSETKTQNGTYDVTNLAEVVVNVSGGGGSSSWTRIGGDDFTHSQTSTRDTTVGTITLPSVWQYAKMIYVCVRDKAGERAGYFYGSDTFYVNTYAFNGSTNTMSTAARTIIYCANVGKRGTYNPGTNTGYGVFPYSITSGGVITIRGRYSSNYSLTINGTYAVDVYLLDWPTGKSPF